MRVPTNEPAHPPTHLTPTPSTHHSGRRQRLAARPAAGRLARGAPPTSRPPPAGSSTRTTPAGAGRRATSRGAAAVSVLALGCGLWFVVCGLWFVVCGFWVLGFGFWVLGFGFWVLGYGLWVLGFGFGFWVLGFGLWGVGYGVGYWVGWAVAKGGKGVLVCTSPKATSHLNTPSHATPLYTAINQVGESSSLKRSAALRAPRSPRAARLTPMQRWRGVS